MGLFKRLYNMLVRDILYKIPKKYLIAIVMFFLIFLFRSDVKASYENYDTIPTDSPAVDCIFYEDSYIYYNRPYDLKLEQNISYNSQGLDGRYTFYFEIKPRSLTSQYDLLSYPNDPFRLYYQYSGGYAGFILNLGGYTNYLASISDFDITKDIYIQIVITETNSISIVSQGDVTRQVNLTFGESYFNEDGLSSLTLAGVGTSPYIKNVLIFTANLGSDYYDDLCNIYPCKYLDTSTGVLQYIPGSFDIVSGLFVYFDQWRYEENTLMAEPPEAIQNYVPATPTPTPTPEYIDYTSNIDNVTNSINNFNNNFFNDNTSNINTNIVTPSVTSTEATSLLTLFNNTLNTWITLLEDTDGVQTINLYLPNFLNRNDPFTITLRSDIIKNVTNGINIPGFNFNVYNAIQIFWYLTLGGYLVHLLLRLYQAFTDGSITNLSSWASKINEEYTKISMFII